MNTHSFSDWLADTFTAEQILFLTITERMELRLKFDEMMFVNSCQNQTLEQNLGWDTVSHDDRQLPSSPVDCFANSSEAMSLHRQCGKIIKRAKRTAIRDEIPGLILGKAKVGVLRVAFECVDGKLLPRLVKTNEKCSDRDRMLAFPAEGFSHPNIVSYRILREHFHTYMIMEYCPSTLSTFPELQADICGFQTVNSILTQVLSALDYLHGCGFAHFDIKPENIGVTQDGRFVLLNLRSVATLGSQSWDTTKELVPLDIPGQLEDCAGYYLVSIEHDLFMLALMLLNMSGSLHWPCRMEAAVRKLVDGKFGHLEAVHTLVSRLNNYVQESGVVTGEVVATQIQTFS